MKTKILNLVADTSCCI